MLFAAIVAALFTAPAAPVSAADRFYLHDSVPFGQWNDGWWDDDACPPPGAERLLCDFPNSACGGTSMPAVCYAFVQFGDTCRAVSYPGGDWTFDGILDRQLRASPIHRERRRLRCGRGTPRRAPVLARRRPFERAPVLGSHLPEPAPGAGRDGVRDRGAPGDVGRREGALSVMPA
jgi:hypothetical protein